MAQSRSNELTLDSMEVGTNSDSGPFLIARLTLIQELSMLSCLFSAQALVQACLAQGIFPDSIIGKSFEAEMETSSWGPAAYGLTTGAFMLPAGRLGDIYGHRRCYTLAWIWLAFSSILAGVSVYSKTFIFYCFCRGLQGMATAMLVPCALAILGSVYKDGSRKNLAFSLYAAGSPFGFTLGGIFSGWIAQVTWWPWIFWITAAVCCSLAVMAIFTIPDLKETQPGLRRSANRPSSDFVNHESRQKFDWAGTFTGVSGLILFNVAWNQGPVVGWSRASTIVTLTIGFLLCVAFILIERRAPQPLIPVGQLASESIFVLATMALAWASFGVLVFYMVNFTTQIRGVGILSTASQFLPVPFSGLLASYLNSFLLGRRIFAADILAFSLLWFIVGSVLLATMPVHQTYWRQMFWIMVLAPFGMDLSFPSATLLMSQLVPPDQQGIAASLIATVVYYSQSIGLGIAGTVQKYTAGGNLLKGYRAAAYTGVVMSGLGFFVALYPVLGRRFRGKSTKSQLEKIARWLSAKT